MGNCFAVNRGNSEIKKDIFHKKVIITVNFFNKCEEIVLSV